MHLSVLKNEVIEYLDPKPNENFIDCTFGEGGHALEILKRNGPRGKVLGIEVDRELFEICKSKFKKLKRLILVCDSYSNLKDIVQREKFGKISGILFDLGLSSWHLEESKRGFTFRKDEPLIMSYFQKEKTAKDLINKLSEREICEILKKYGEERFAKKIAKEIVKERKKKPIETTFQLVEIIKRATPIWYQRKKIHFATKTFQALRIFVNEELENLKIALPQALEILEKGGRLVVISFHSLEDRLVKNFFKENEISGKLKILTKKPISPSQIEIKINKRARSAKLRAGEKI
jgi:16S rRNA (cytosine1402-N4)-methyltransferase